MALASQPPGAIMAHFCVQFRTMALLCDVAPHATIPALLALLARSAELSHIHIRCASAVAAARCHEGSAMLSVLVCVALSRLHNGFEACQSERFHLHL